MYRLIVNTNIEHITGKDKWIDLDLGSTTVALTYQANDLAELKSREVNRSNRIKLPRTPINDAVFEIPSDPLSITITPYRYFDCRLYDDGVELFGEGAKLQLMDTTSATYEVCIRGSLFDFFDRIKNLSLRDLDAKKYFNETGVNLESVLWNVATVANTSLNHDVVFPLVDWDTANNANLTYSQPGIPTNAFDEDPIPPPIPDPENPPPPPIIQGDARIHVESKYIFPAVKLHRLVDAICKVQGYAIDLPASVKNNEPECKYMNAVIPITSLKSSQEDMDRITDIYFRAHGVMGTTKYFEFKPSYGAVKGLEYKWDSRSVINPPVSGKYTFVLEGKVIAAETRRIEFHYNTETRRGEAVPITITAGEQFRHVVAIDLTANEELRFNLQVKPWIFYPVLIEGLTLRCIKFEGSEAIFPADKFPLAKNLPNITQLDLIKAVCQLYGLVVSVNDREKRIEAYTMDTVVENMRERSFVDWSDKLDDREHRTTFQWNSYGQRSYLAYAEEEGRDGEKLTNRACFTLDNSTLPLEKTLFEVPFATCEEAYVRGLTMAKIRMVTNGESDSDKISEPKPKLLFLTKVDNVEAKFESKNSGIKILKNTVLSAIFTPLSMEQFIGTYYKTLSTRMLPRARMMREKLWLTPLDMYSFDHRIPIYLSKYGCCFYVNKVSNYQPRKLTDVELVAILPEK